jgi:hypothetical protein
MKGPEHCSGLFPCVVYKGRETRSGKMMSVDDKKTKATAKKEPLNESKATEAAPKTDALKADVAKPDAATSNKGMGEGQKPVSQAYKDNWNAIFAKKKKR